MNKIQTRYITIDDEYAGQRIDNFLFNLLKTVPKSHIYRLIRKGEVRINKKRVDQKYRLQGQDLLRIPPMELTEKKVVYTPSDKIINKLTASILYESDTLLAINKPAGIPVHGGSGIYGGIVEALRVIYPQYKLELAHRLDRDTSGCLLLAKKRSMLHTLHELFRQNKIIKTYLALVMSHWPETKKTVHVRLLRNQLRSGERMVTIADDEGKESITHFKPLEYFDMATLVEARLETGRTHQIRVHAAHSGHPIACDDRYGDKAFNKFMKSMGCSRMFLHAASLEFQLPDQPDKIKLKADLPTELQEVLHKIKSV